MENKKTRNRKARLEIQLSDELKKHIEKQAKELKISKSDYIEKVVLNFTDEKLSLIKEHQNDLKEANKYLRNISTNRIKFGNLLNQLIKKLNLNEITNKEAFKYFMEKVNAFGEVDLKILKILEGKKNGSHKNDTP